MSSTTFPPSRGSPSASTAACHALLGTRAIASRTEAVIANTIEYSTVRPPLVPCSVSQSSSPWEAPAPARGSKILRILALREHLAEEQVTCVVMEATSDYRKPFYYLLEICLESRWSW